MCTAKTNAVTKAESAGFQLQVLDNHYPEGGVLRADRQRGEGGAAIAGNGYRALPLVRFLVAIALVLIAVAGRRRLANGERLGGTSYEGQTEVRRVLQFDQLGACPTRGIRTTPRPCEREPVPPPF